MDWIIEHIKNASLEFVELFIFGLIFFFIERLNPAEKDTPYFKDDFKNEIFLAASNILFFIPISLFIAVLLVEMTIRPVFPEQMFDEQIQSLPIMVQVILGALILDFSVYWKHRFSHHFMWSFHSIHHSAKQLTWITSLRLHPAETFIGTVFASFILYIFGFEGVGFLGALIIMRVMNYFTHINMDLKFDKPLRYIIASPAYHRWHHACVKSAYDKNFCGAFPILDIIFGTYYHPETLPPKYGLSAIEQKDYPDESFMGWLAYPFKRDYKLWKRRRAKRQEQSSDS